MCMYVCVCVCVCIFLQMSDSIYKRRIQRKRGASEFLSSDGKRKIRVFITGKFCYDSSSIFQIKNFVTCSALRFSVLLKPKKKFRFLSKSQQ